MEEVFQAVGSQDVVILEPDPTLQRVGINTWLEGKNIALFKHILAARNNTRGLMAAMAESMTSMMPETLLTNLLGIQKGLDFGIHVACADARLDHRFAQADCLHRNFPSPMLQIGGLARAERAARVGEVKILGGENVQDV